MEHHALRELVLEQLLQAQALERLQQLDLPFLANEIARLDQQLIDLHLPHWERVWSRTKAADREVRIDRIRSEHVRFRTSIRQLRWSFSIVLSKNHGGNRQALGQYWMLVLDSLLQHLDDEADLHPYGDVFSQFYA
jgi:hypothetical protein